jgi:hypothetical protein
LTDKWIDLLPKVVTTPAFKLVQLDAADKVRAGGRDVEDVAKGDWVPFVVVIPALETVPRPIAMAERFFPKPFTVRGVMVS